MPSNNGVIRYSDFTRPPQSVEIANGRVLSLHPIDMGTAQLLADSGGQLDKAYEAMSRLLRPDFTREEFDAMTPDFVSALLEAAGSKQVAAAEKIVGES